MYNIIITKYNNIVIEIIRVFTLLSSILRKPIIKSTNTAITASDVQHVGTTPAHRSIIRYYDLSAVIIIHLIVRF